MQVRVYAYMVYNIEEDHSFKASAYATADAIERENLKAISDDYLDVDRSLINDRGRYHPPAEQPGLA